MNVVQDFLTMYVVGIVSIVELAKPKPKAGPDCYYATSLSCKVCEKFDPKY